MLGDIQLSRIVMLVLISEWMYNFKKSATNGLWLTLRITRVLR